MGKHADKINRLAEKKKAEKIVAYLSSKDPETRIDAIRALGNAAVRKRSTT